MSKVSSKETDTLVDKNIKAHCGRCKARFPYPYKDLVNNYYKITLCPTKDCNREILLINCDKIEAIFSCS